ncbi:lytic polysaccharide monooxygenase [Cylindrobasidium torrendii FP15055 ss-10]|uniref:AA9 family lytic polysaccharide monooxygenase n=1 Tax=Cylindrobasidium torrendii FP15055 ss-10 TaxID=1314674 RepID=A0A0D7AYH5_9AGAR|nr:lytic polysaccharide monooxygenase [Cylindrobasidium torrendii FP15055 ss-10]
MKFAFSAAAALAFIQPALAHYRFTSLIGPDGTVTGAYEYVRQNTNNNSPVENLQSTDMRCNVGADSGSGTSTMEVAAGSTVGFKADQAVFHPGPYALYMGKAPEGTTAAEWDGSGSAWFKIAEKGAIIGDGTFEFDTTMTEYTGTIPSSVADGEYLLRIEHIGLHSAGAPQFYISCAQIKVSGGGSASPATVEIPGYVSISDESLSLSIYYPVPTSYDVPGPAVFGGDGSSSPAPSSSAATPASSSAAPPASSSAAEPASTSVATSPSSSAAPAPSSSAAAPASSSSAASAPSSSAASPAPSSSVATPAPSSSAAAPATSSSAAAPAPTSSTCAKDGYNCCMDAYNACAAKANSAANNGGNVDFSACSSAKDTCVAGLARRHARQWSRQL